MFLWDIFVIPYLTKLQAFNCTLQLYWKGNVWQKHVEITFNSRENYIWMPMPKCQCRDFQVAVSKIKILKKNLYRENEQIQQKK